jgi:hypothetical protein
LPSERARQAHGAAADAERLAKARRSAWVLGGMALAFYFGYMAWMFVRGSIG